MRQHGLGPGDNVSAELGTTWFCLVRRPEAAAHVLGKLLQTFGEDNVIWGTDSIWYGPTRPVVDAFRAFRIPERLCERVRLPAAHGPSQGEDPRRQRRALYGIDVDAARGRRRADNLGWLSAARAEFERTGVPIST